MNQKTIIRDLTTGNPIKQLLVFALPFIFANVLQQAYMGYACIVYKDIKAGYSLIEPVYDLRVG